MVITKSFSQNVSDLLLKILLPIVIKLAVILSPLCFCCDVNNLYFYVEKNYNLVV